jgi:hypothetical protein
MVYTVVPTSTYPVTLPTVYDDVPLRNERETLPEIPAPVNDKSNTEALAGTAPANAPTPAITPANTKFFIGNPLIDKIAVTKQSSTGFT